MHERRVGVVADGVQDPAHVTEEEAQQVDAMHGEAADADHPDLQAMSHKPLLHRAYLGGRNSRGTRVIEASGSCAAG
jgi:hypothetical protein